DDFQVAAGGPAESALEQFILDRFVGVNRPQLIVGSRMRPELNPMRAELGTVTVLSGDDLRFRSWEVAELFADIYRYPLSPGDLDALMRHTDGWATGLHLFHLGAQGLGPVERRATIRALDGGSPCPNDYLARTVLRDLPARSRE